MRFALLPLLPLLVALAAASPAGAASFFLTVSTSIAHGATDSPPLGGVAASPDVSNPHDVETFAGYVYWTDTGLSPDQVLRRPVNSAGTPTGPIETVLSAANAPGGFLAGPEGLYIDRSGGFLWVTDTIGDRILRSALDGSGAVTVLTTPVDQAANDVFLANGRIYWTDGDGVRSAPLSDPSNQRVEVSGGGLAGTSGLFVDAANDLLYFTSTDLDNISRVPIDLASGNVVYDESLHEIYDAGSSSGNLVDLDIDLSTGLVVWTEEGLDRARRGTLGAGDITGVADVYTGIDKTRGIALVPEPALAWLVLAALAWGRVRPGRRP